MPCYSAQELMVEWTGFRWHTVAAGSWCLASKHFAALCVYSLPLQHCSDVPSVVQGIADRACAANVKHQANDSIPSCMSSSTVPLCL